jgi:hypothetical protein
MNRHNFPVIAVLISVPLLLLLIYAAPGPDGASAAPLLALLLAAEFGAIANLIAAYLGLPALRERPLPWRRLLRLVGNLFLALTFVLALLRLWPI